MLAVSSANGCLLGVVILSYSAAVRSRRRRWAALGKSEVLVVFGTSALFGMFKCRRGSSSMTATAKRRLGGSVVLERRPKLLCLSLMFLCAWYYMSVNALFRRDRTTLIRTEIYS